MNGGAASGRIAAEKFLKTISKPNVTSIPAIASAD